MIVFVAFRPNTYPFLMNGDNEYENAKRRKQCVIKRRTKFNYYKDCLFNNKTRLQSQQRFKSEDHNVYTEEITKIAQNSNDDKRLQTFDKITTYPYGKKTLSKYVKVRC